MSRYCFHDDTNFFDNTNSFGNLWDYYTGADDRSQLLTWLSPLKPWPWYKGILERRVETIGEWVLETEEFRSWYASSGGRVSDKAVLFCYGDPGVGKTFIR